MIFLNIVKLALISLNRNRVRSFFTSLSIIIGISFVVIIAAWGQGTYNSVMEELSHLSPNTIIVTSNFVKGFRNTIKDDDFRPILKNCPSITLGSPICPKSVDAVFPYKRFWDLRAVGITEDFFKIRNLKIVKGRSFSSTEISNGAKVCIIEEKLINHPAGYGNMFNNDTISSYLIGKKIRISGIPFQIIGISTSNLKRGEERNVMFNVYIPWTLAQKRFRKRATIPWIYFSAISTDFVNLAKTEIEEVLRRKHKIRKGKIDDFEVNTLANIIDYYFSTEKNIAFLLAFIASITLLVGGIGVMNIMLVSVTERTKEIGIRMALGAKSSYILWQFLIESVVLTSIGGVVGIICGIGLTKVLGLLTNITPIVSTTTIIISIAFSVCLGIFFGLYPAYKASLLDPIEAIAS